MMRELGSEYLFPCTTHKNVEQVKHPIGASQTQRLQGAYTYFTTALGLAPQQHGKHCDSDLRMMSV